MFIILGLATIYMFYLKMPSVAQTNFLRERTDSIVVSALPKRNHDAVSSNQINDENDEDRMDALLGGGSSEAPLGLGQVASSMWSLFMKPRFLMLIPQCAWTGVSIAFFSGNLVEMMAKSLEAKGST